MEWFAAYCMIAGGALASFQFVDRRRWWVHFALSIIWPSIIGAILVLILCALANGTDEL